MTRWGGQAVGCGAWGKYIDFLPRAPDLSLLLLPAPIHHLLQPQRTHTDLFIFSMKRGRPRATVAPCRFCHRRFKRQEHLQRHERTRTQPCISTNLYCLHYQILIHLIDRHQRETIHLSLWPTFLTSVSIPSVGREDTRILEGSRGITKP
jgi:hypothetical protein